MYRKFTGQNGHDYYISLDRVNAADDVLVDIHDPNSQGFGGRLFELETPDGVVQIRGPWHSSCPFDVAEISELHRTKVTILRNTEHIPYKEWADYNEDSIEFRFGRKGEIILDEKDWVIGHFSRGDRIAQQLASLWQEELWAHIESDGGSHSRRFTPNAPLHLMAQRAKKPDLLLSAEQSHFISS